MTVDDHLGTVVNDFNFQQAIIDIAGVTFNSKTEAPAGEVWSRVDPPADPLFDIILDYPPGKDTTRLLDTSAPVALPDPQGMSGGGLWDQGFSGNTLWHPEDASLIGVQSSWHPESRYVRVVQIVHWLRLVHEHYPDLRLTLEKLFPEMGTK